MPQALDRAGSSVRARHRRVGALALRYSVVAALALIAVMTIHYRTTLHVEATKRETGERLNVELGRLAVERTLAGAVADLRYLAEAGESRALFDPGTPRWQNALGEALRIFARQKGVYDQVRYLDQQGMERVRVNVAGSTAVVVPQTELQDKSDRYYFRESFSLNPGAIYTSPLDLNIERGEIEQPHNPTMRLSTPVRGAGGEKIGVLVLNFMGQTLLHAFRTAVANIGDHAMLVNGGGFWLSSPNRDEEWGFMLEHRRSFASSHPEAWHRIAQEEAGQFAAPDGVYTFATIHPALAARIETGRGDAAEPPPEGVAHWKIVSHVSPQRLAAGPAEFLGRHLWLYALLFVLTGVTTIVLAQAVVRHRTAEAQLAFSKRFREILENVSLLALGLDRNGRIVFGNEALCASVERGREALLGRDWLETLVAQEHRERCRALLHDIVFTQEPLLRHEFALRTTAGESRLISWSTARLTDADGQVIGVTCIGDDITEARETEQALRKVSRAIEQSPSTVMITDLRGAIEYVNPKFTQLTGYSLEEIRGRNPRVLKSGETGAQEYQRLWQAITSGEEWRGVFHNRKKSGELYWEAACISPIRDASGAITHLLAVKEDITERRRLEEEIERRKQEASRNEALAEVGRMANMVAHDLRNPLSSVKMTLQIYGRWPARRWKPEDRELQQIALEQVHHMEEILSDMLTYSRPESPEPEWLSVERVLDAAALVAQKCITEHRVRLTRRYRTALPMILADAAKLRQAFANLLENAAQATEGVTGREHEIEVATDLELGADGPWIRVEICDNGVGLAPEHEKRLFEPFYTTRAQGTGLGLAIVRRVVELHGGSVTLHQPSETRTCAKILLPARTSGAGAAPAGTPAATEAVAERESAA